MDRFGSVPDTTTNNDHSPALPPGAVKDMLIAAAGEYLPGFSYLAYQDGTYFFQRTRNAAGQSLHELLHLTCSLDDGYFVCSVASRLNPAYRFSTVMNRGIVNPHQDLKVLRHGTDNPPQRDAYYRHSGRMAGTAATVRDIFADYRRYGVPFLDQQWNTVQHHPLLRAGFDYLDGLRIDRAALQAELVQAIGPGELKPDRLQHPLYQELRETLRQLSGLSRAHRALIPLTAYELLQWYGQAESA
jgi:hypothetical protein